MWVGKARPVLMIWSSEEGVLQPWARCKDRLSMDVRTEIRKLARMEESPFPFLSLYIDTKWDDEQQRERTRLFTKNQLKRAYERLKDQENRRSPFLEDQKLIERYVDGLTRHAYEEGVNGFAIFSCSGNKIFLTYPSSVPYENEFFLSDLPILRPLVRLSSQYRNTLAVMVDTHSARLFEISMEGLLAESHIETYVPGRHDQGGWAQRRFQRHIKDHMDKHHREVAEQLTELFDSGNWERVVLIGQDRILANFRAFLPERVRQQIADAFSVDFSEGRASVLRRISERLLQKEKEETSHQIQELKERGLQNGLATFGLNATLEALNRGQVRTLYLLNRFSQSGGRCHRCRTLVLAPPSQDQSLFCPLCKQNTKRVDLGEECTRSVLRQDGEVKWVDDDPVLKENEGMAASLRFRLSG